MYVCMYVCMFVCIIYIDTSLGVEGVVYARKTCLFRPALGPNAVSTHCQWAKSLHHQKFRGWKKGPRSTLTHWQWAQIAWSDFRLFFSYGRMRLCMLKGSHSCTFVDDFRICVRLRNWPYLCTSVSRFHLGPRLVRISVSMLCFCLCSFTDVHKNEHT